MSESSRKHFSVHIADPQGKWQHKIRKSVTSTAPDSEIERVITRVSEGGFDHIGKGTTTRWVAVGETGQIGEKKAALGIVSSTPDRPLPPGAKRWEMDEIRAYTVKLESPEGRSTYHVVACESPRCFDTEKRLIFHQGEVITIYPDCGPRVIQLPKRVHFLQGAGPIAMPCP